MATVFKMHKFGLAVRLFGCREVLIDSVRMEGESVVFDVYGSDVPDCAEIAVSTSQDTIIIPK